MGVVWPAERKPSRVGRLHGNGSYYWDFHLREVSLANLHLKDLFGITLLVGDFVVLGDTWDSRLGRRLLDNVDRQAMGLGRTDCEIELHLNVAPRPDSRSLRALEVASYASTLHLSGANVVHAVSKNSDLRVRLVCGVPV